MVFHDSCQCCVGLKPNVSCSCSWPPGVATLDTKPDESGLAGRVRERVKPTWSENPPPPPPGNTGPRRVPRQSGGQPGGAGGATPPNPRPPLESPGACGAGVSPPRASPISRSRPRSVAGVTEKEAVTVVRNGSKRDDLRPTWPSHKACDVLRLKPGSRSDAN